MSEGGWTPEGWEERAPAQPPERLPRLEDLPPAEHGYDRAAVQQAFEAFYRHAAQLDTTLRMLESMEIFARQAKDLREDIRALRASAWGPVPAPRPSWSAGTAERTYSRAGSGVPETLPRLAVEAAFIVLVAIGAAVAELDAWLIVVLVLGAFLLVAIFEVVASTRRARPRPGLLPSRVEAPAAPAPAPAAPEEVQPAVVAAAAEATMIEPGPEAVAPEPEPEPEPAVAPEPEPEVALEPEPEPVLPPAVSAVAAEDPWEDRAEIVQLEAAPEPAPEPAPVSGAGEDTMDVPVVQAVSEPAPTRFRRRRR